MHSILVKGTEKSGGWGGGGVKAVWGSEESSDSGVKPIGVYTR